MRIAPRLLLLVSLVELAAAGAARAAPPAPPKIVVIGPSAHHATVLKLRDELRLLGFQVETVVGAPKPAVASGAAAIARVEDWPPEIIITGLATGGDVHIGGALSGPVESGMLALRAAELLHGRLLGGPDKGDPEAPPPPVAIVPVPAAPVAPCEVAPPCPSSATSGLVGLAVLAGPGALSASPHLRLGGHWRALPHVRLDVGAFVPTLAASVGDAKGAIDARILGLTAGVSGVLEDSESGLGASVGLGLGGAWIVFEGEATAPATAAGGSRWVALPHAILGGSYRLGPALSLRVDVLSALSAPEPVFQIAGREVASFGRPAFWLSAGLEVRL